MISYSEHFSDADFPVGIPHPLLVSALESARVAYQKPIVVTSGGRTPEHNTEVGGVEKSTHLMDATGTFKGCDIKCEDDGERFVLLGILMQRFKRIGVYKKHFHVDVADDMDHPLWKVWVGED